MILKKRAKKLARFFYLFSNLMKNLLTIFFLMSVLFAVGQDPKEIKRIYTYTEFVDSINAGKYQYINIELRHGGDRSLDSLYYVKTKRIKKETQDTVSYMAIAPISGIEFTSYLDILDSEINVKFEDCIFKKGFGIWSSELNTTSFTKCLFEGTDSEYGFYESVLNHNLSFDECTFTNDWGLAFTDSKSTSISRLSINDCSFNNLKKYSSNEYDLLFVNVEFGQLSISNSSFQKNKKEGQPNISFSNLKVDFFKMISVNVPFINVGNLTVNEDFIVNNLTLKDRLVIAKMHFEDEGLNLAWKNISGNKIYIDPLEEDDFFSYNALSEVAILNEFNFNRLLKQYNRFFTMYKGSGDLKSANACYIEMKDLETRRLKYLYETESGIDNYLNYKLNVFLKFFAEYGTSPVRSVQISGWVILLFAFFYFFFYSAWDQINRKFLMDRGSQLMSYFKSEQKLEELYSAKHKEDLSTFNEFKQNLKESKTQVPFFFMLFLKPLYWVAVVKHKSNKALYKRVEFLQGKWVDLTAGKKLFLGTLTFLTIITYALYLIAIRSLNSLILSVNTFTTLGFGDIPVVGVSRYVAILEGFLGWFLLSIFSVSLISQILQN